MIIDDQPDPEQTTDLRPADDALSEVSGSEVGFFWAAVTMFVLGCAALWVPVIAAIWVIWLLYFSS